MHVASVCAECACMLRARVVEQYLIVDRVLHESDRFVAEMAGFAALLSRGEQWGLKRLADTGRFIPYSISNAGFVEQFFN